MTLLQAVVPAHMHAKPQSMKAGKLPAQQDEAIS
jgi:hypothetical protein